MSNFSFLKTEFPQLYKSAYLAEQRIRTEPVTAGFHARLALEMTVKEIYHLENLDWPHDTGLYSLMTQEDFKALVDPRHYEGVMGYTRRIGNDAAHKGKVSTENALRAVKYLYGFVKWFAYTYSDTLLELPGAFDEQALPKIGDRERKLKEIQQENKKAQERLEAEKEALIRELKAVKETAKENQHTFDTYQKQLQVQAEKITHQKATRQNKPPCEYNEAETRTHIIDVSLAEAGWTHLREGVELEYPVEGMPKTPDNPMANGFADYVLWDDEGKPLAIIEAKSVQKAADNGRHQAKLYADCLEQMHQQRPIIFYSNGYETYLWDDVFYAAPRRLYGFLTKEELLYKIQQRTERKDIRIAKVNENIAGRHYQKQAIKQIAESWLVSDASEKGFRGSGRKALLVMATGAGKTRTAAALVSVLMKNNWARKVLFLADRNALVTQAKRSFGEHLKQYTSIDLTQDKEAANTRLVFSTYPTMMNRIDAFQNGERLYGVGHFDLIIVDEAHRSVYNKYQAIFDYFDALLVGLTATPKKNIDANTYEVFQREDENPTYSYELGQAVNEKHLVPYHSIDVTTEFIREGIRYNQLKAKEKKAYEATFEDAVTGDFPDQISSSELNKKLFNKDTVFKVLDQLMEKGQKVEQGDKLGKTIVFAANQKHALFILECFQERYPDCDSDFAKVVHHGVSHSQSIIDDFCLQDRDVFPQLVISVDMMDTGIDAPRVVNLVFFKIVRSYAKFWQMIGRGTRLCPHLFGPGQHKKDFYIFDACDNFAFFEENPRGLEAAPAPKLSQLLFEARLELAILLEQHPKEAHLAMSKKLLDHLHRQIQQLNTKRFDVQMQLRAVQAFEDRAVWNGLNSDQVHLLKSKLASLPPPEKTDEITRRFDLLVLRMQLYNLTSDGKEHKCADNLMGIAERLKTKYAIKEVSRRKELIEHMSLPACYKGISQQKLDEIRTEIRDLMVYLKENTTAAVYFTHFEDDLVGDAQVREGVIPYNTTSEGYKKRVESIVLENKHHLTIRKIQNNLPIVESEIKGLEALLFSEETGQTRAAFKETFGDQPLGKFIRSIVGITMEAAQKSFASFLQDDSLSANQIKFVETIIRYLEKNGTIDPRMLSKAPFDDVHSDGIHGVFSEQKHKRAVISIVQSINENAAVG
jgi:type I restriction enzyme R subunit